MSTPTLGQGRTTLTALLGADGHAAAQGIDAERCDRCGHRAYVVTVHPTTGGPKPLAWCAHHYTAITPTAHTGMLARDVRSRLVNED